MKVVFWHFIISNRVIGQIAGGVETVYDFATFERQTFWYASGGFTDSSGVGAYLYGGVVKGFHTDQDIIRDYEGPFIVLQGGVSFNHIGIGISNFRSIQDLSVRGATYYVGGSIALDAIPIFDLGVLYLKYFPKDNQPKSYVLANNKINTAQLKFDISSGNGSPWFSLLGGPAIASRAYITSLLLWYTNAYTEIKNAK